MSIIINRGRLQFGMIGTDMSWSQSVYSSVVSEVGYDSDSGELLVTWSKSGKVSAYQGVPEDVAQRLANAPSVGQMINDEIKPYFSHSYR
jgi:hypothetical protein